MDPLKAEQLTSSKWRVLAIPFGGPIRGRDTDTEYFSPRTDVKADWFPERPVLWHHGKDETMGNDSVGTEADMELQKDGWWATVWLDRVNRYWARIDSMLRAGKAYGSSGPVAHLVKKSRDGEILVWPHAEQTITPTPANFFSRLIPVKALEDHFTSAGIALGADLETYLSAKDGESPAMGELDRTLDLLEETLRHF